MSADAPISHSETADRRSSVAPSNSNNLLEHQLKSWPQFFETILRVEKTHELRRSDDRNFHVGDTLHLREFDPKSNRYTGRELRATITYITSVEHPCALSENSLNPDFCILSIRKT